MNYDFIVLQLVLCIGLFGLYAVLDGSIITKPLQNWLAWLESPFSKDPRTLGLVTGQGIKSM